MTDPTGPGGPDDADDVTLDRDAIPELLHFFDGLDTLAGPLPDPEIRLDHIARASSIATHRWRAGDRPALAPSWGSIGWRVAAVAAGLVVVTVGLGVDDRLPAPAQRVVSSIADQIGIDLPDGSDGRSNTDRPSAKTSPGAGNPGDPERPAPRSQPIDEIDDGTAPGDTSQETGGPEQPTSATPRQGSPASPATPAAPARVGDPGVPADPATPAAPAEPATQAQPERPEQAPAAPARPTIPEQRNEPERPTPPESGVQSEPADDRADADAKSAANP